MAKLIVEEGGKRRAFRMSKGVLTVGSGAEARLKLSSTDVAEIHFELELSAAGLKLRPRPGVVPPKVNGTPAQSEIVLAPGQAIEVGSARLSLELEEGDPGPPAPVATSPVATPSVPTSSAGPSAAPVARRSAARGGRSTPTRSGRARSSGEPRRGIPSWVTTIVILALVGLLLVVWSKGVGKASQGEDLARNRIRSARQAVEAGQFEEALAGLAGIPASALTPRLEADKKTLEADIRRRKQEADQTLANQSGTRFLDTLLKKYEGLYLQGSPPKAKVRLFLKRCRTFHERWPTHPELDWVKRQESRFAGYVDINAAPDWADVAWEVKYLTGGAPRNYVAAFALMDELLTRVSGSDRTEAEALRDTLIAERPAYADDKLEQARYEFDRKEDPSKSVWWLVHNIAWIDDEALANKSARYLVKMPDLTGHLLAYKLNYPDRYQTVMKNAVIAGWAVEAGFTP